MTSKMVRVDDFVLRRMKEAEEEIGVPTYNVLIYVLLEFWERNKYKYDMRKILPSFKGYKSDILKDT